MPSSSQGAAIARSGCGLAPKRSPASRRTTPTSSIARGTVSTTCSGRSTETRRSTAFRPRISRTRRTCGRGSGAASIVAYLLGITHVDPVRHTLFFERFLSPERKDPPDIDVDFAWDERDAIQLAVLEENGAPVRAAMVANHVGFRAKGAIHEIAKVYGLPEAEIMNVTKKLARDLGPV